MLHSLQNQKKIPIYDHILHGYRHTKVNIHTHGLRTNADNQWESHLSSREFNSCVLHMLANTSSPRHSMCSSPPTVPFHIFPLLVKLQTGIFTPWETSILPDPGQQVFLTQESWEGTLGQTGKENFSFEVRAPSSSSFPRQPAFSLPLSPPALTPSSCFASEPVLTLPMAPRWGKSELYLCLNQNALYFFHNINPKALALHLPKALYIQLSSLQGQTAVSLLIHQAPKVFTMLFNTTFVNQNKIHYLISFKEALSWPRAGNTSRMCLYKVVHHKLQKTVTQKTVYLKTDKSSQQSYLWSQSSSGTT